MATPTRYQEIARTEESQQARDQFVPPLTPYPFMPFILRNGTDEIVSPPQPFEGNDRNFSNYGRAWSSHLSDVQKWFKHVSDDCDLPLTERDILAGNRLICLDYLCDHVLCPDMCLRASTDTIFFDSECMALLNRRFLLIPYEEDGVFVNIVYDRRIDAVSTFDAVERGRQKRHENAVKALRSFIERCGLPCIPFVASQMQSRTMKPGDDRYHGYVVLEGARVFLRENQADRQGWTDWSSSMLNGMRRVQLITETQARVTWIEILREAVMTWGDLVAIQGA
ncbi:hypothetical protein F5Y06DRAFT_302591 [Hypoxylon sp. FL0890]|nr:hypothetical protein F5Y06DRAFT_302591 [Hypoxylon sp. FL0890]